MNYYVYVYLDTMKPGKFKYGKYEFGYEPFYIGKGKRYRYRQHMYNNSKYVKNKHLFYKIRKIQEKTNKNPIILKYKNNLSENLAFLLEKRMILTIGKKNENTGPLCNLTDGGEGVSGYTHSEKTKKLMRKHWKEYYKNPENREKISRGLKNSELWRSVISSAEWKENVSKGHLNPDSQFQKTMKSDEFSEACRKSKLGKLNPQYGLTNVKSMHYNKGRKIYKFSLDGTLINEYNNSIRAEEDNPGTDRSTIMGRCKGRSNKHYRGYLYSFNNETLGFFKKLEKTEDGYHIIDNNNGTCILKQKSDVIKHFKLSRFAINEYLKNKV